MSLINLSLTTNDVLYIYLTVLHLTSKYKKKTNHRVTHENCYNQQTLVRPNYDHKGDRFCSFVRFILNKTMCRAQDQGP